MHPYNPKNNPQPANIEILHTLKRYATHNGQNALNITFITHKRTNETIYNPLRQYKRAAPVNRIQPITATKTDYKVYYLYSYIITLLHYKKHYYKVHKYILLKKFKFFIKSIAYQKYFISLHLKLCLKQFLFFEITNQKKCKVYVYLFTFGLYCYCCKSCY